MIHPSIFSTAVRAQQPRSTPLPSGHSLCVLMESPQHSPISSSLPSSLFPRLSDALPMTTAFDPTRRPSFSVSDQDLLHTLGIRKLEMSSFDTKTDSAQVCPNAATVQQPTVFNSPASSPLKRRDVNCSAPPTSACAGPRVSTPLCMQGKRSFADELKNHANDRLALSPIRFQNHHGNSNFIRRHRPRNLANTFLTNIDENDDEQHHSPRRVNNDENVENRLAFDRQVLNRSATISPPVQLQRQSVIVKCRQMPTDLAVRSDQCCEQVDRLSTFVSPSTTAQFNDVVDSNEDGENAYTPIETLAAAANANYAINTANTSASTCAILSQQVKRGRPKLEMIKGLMNTNCGSSSTIRCNLCNRVFPREKSLQAHIRTHTGEKPYVCTHSGCYRKFAQSGQLRTHQRLHTGEKPFVCSFPGTWVDLIDCKLELFEQFFPFHPRQQVASIASHTPIVTVQRILSLASNETKNRLQRTERV